jgi:hypothetical protein
MFLINKEQARSKRRNVMSTIKATTFFGLFKDGYEASDGQGHRGEGNTTQEAQTRLKQAQELGVEWVKPLGTGPKIG